MGAAVTQGVPARQRDQMNLLITNDDGVYSPGILALARTVTLVESPRAALASGETWK